MKRAMGQNIGLSENYVSVYLLLQRWYIDKKGIKALFILLYIQITISFLK